MPHEEGIPHGWIIEKVEKLEIQFATTGFVVDLLITDGECYHYVLITELVNLVQKAPARQIDAHVKISRNCFHVCSKNETLQKLEKICYEFETGHVLLPEPDSNSLAFKNFKQKQLFHWLSILT